MMQKSCLRYNLTACLCLVLAMVWSQPSEPQAPRVELLSPQLKSQTSIEEALQFRRSSRQFSPEKLTLQQLSQLLWAGQGITSPLGLRTAPSAGAKYPLELYVISNQMEGLEPGIYHYLPQSHLLEKRSDNVAKNDLYSLSFKQSWVKDAPLLLIITANFAKTEEKYHRYAPAYVYMEAGHAAQNIMLQSVSLKLAIVGVGGFEHSKLNQLLGLKQEQSIYILCIGKMINPNLIE